MGVVQESAAGRNLGCGICIPRFGYSSHEHEKLNYLQMQYVVLTDNRDTV